MPPKARDKRTYDQECGLAHALDLVGERWTLLIVRELLMRPRRYKELLDALPGIGTNLLADRLAFLTKTGLVVPTEPDRRTSGYRLTELGRSLHGPILELARFGMKIAAGRSLQPGTETRATWATLAIEAMLDDARAAEIDETYQFEVDDEVFHVVVHGGRATLELGPAPEPTLTVATDAPTFFALGMRRENPLEAVLSGTVRVTGTPAAMPRCLHLIGLSDWQPKAAVAG